MNHTNVVYISSTIETQPSNVQGLTSDERDALIVSTLVIDGHQVIVSRYADDVWKIVGHPTNTQSSDRRVDFGIVPKVFRATMKEILYRYIRRGRAGKKRPSARSIVKLLDDARPFLQHLNHLNITRLADATPMICAVYADSCKQSRQSGRADGKAQLLKASTLAHRFAVVETIYELSQHAGDKMAAHPWPGTSAHHMAGLTGPGTGYRGGKTPLIPDEVFTALFQAAWEIVENGDMLLDIRDNMALAKDFARNENHHGIERYLQQRGWANGLGAFRKALRDLRTACYIVVASVSGCRNHELALIQSNACYSTEDQIGEVSKDSDPIVYWWMRSQSVKTDQGQTVWMVPGAAVSALRIMDRWAKPYQARIEAEIALRRASDPLDPEIAEALRHANAIFLANTKKKGDPVRTMSNQAWNLSLRGFAKRCGVNWDLATHQFRRKFANYAARSQFGDLRYLREHFKHWSLDMTLGYALNESQEVGLYVEIQDELDEIKEGLVDIWLKPDEPLAGGYGSNIVAWRRGEAVTVFKSHKQMVRVLGQSTAIRSNGHAWCTADDNQCVGNDIELTRCTDCRNAVIGRQHVRLYSGLHDHLKEVAKFDDIGQGGLNIVRRDMERCRSVLASLGHNVLESGA